MNYSIRHCAFVISALLIGVSAIDLNTPAQARPTRQDRERYYKSFIYECSKHMRKDACKTVAENQWAIKQAIAAENQQTIETIAAENQQAIQAENQRAIKAAQARPKPQNRDYTLAVNQATSAVFQCYDQQDRNACNQVTQIKSTFESRCYQNDRNACSAYKDVTAVERMAMDIQNLKRVR
jgi:SpoVK/Ycf46/Vps4 family AAA+-type ATPase